MLIKTHDISPPQPSQETTPESISIRTEEQTPRFLSDPSQLLTRIIGQLSPMEAVHFYSWANFNLVRLIIYILQQTGPAHLFMTSYSFSQKSIESLLKRKNDGRLLSVKLLIDNRVKVMSPKPFQMLSGSFDYRCISVHAKVALIWNNSWQISIVTSQNATDNPKLERGTIYTYPDLS